MITDAQFDILDRLPSYQRRKRINQSIKATFPNVEHLEPGEWFSIDGSARGALELEIASRIYEVRRYHSPDAALDECLDILDELLDAFDKCVADAYLKGREDQKIENDEKLFRQHVLSWQEGFDFAISEYMDD